MKQKVKYVGWVGKGNLGDEALHEASKKLFSKWDLTTDVVNTDIQLFGGGTVLPLWCSNTPPREHNIAFGVGVRNPAFFNRKKRFDLRSLLGYPFQGAGFMRTVGNPFHIGEPYIRRKDIKNLCGYFDYVGVRGFQSQKTLSEWNISSEVIGDTALALEVDKEMREQRIIINIGASGEVYGSHEHMLKILKEVCKKLGKDYDIWLVLLNKKDKKLAQYLHDYVDVTAYPREVQSAINLYAQSYMSIGERLHAGVFSAIASTPSVMLGYRPKCYDFAESINQEKNHIRLDKLSEKKLLKTIERIEKEYDKEQKMIASNISKYRKKLERKAYELMERYKYAIA